MTVVSGATRRDLPAWGCSSQRRLLRPIASVQALSLNRTGRAAHVEGRMSQTLTAAIGQLRVAGGRMQYPHVDPVRPTRAVWPTARPRPRSDRRLSPETIAPA